VHAVEAAKITLADIAPFVRQGRQSYYRMPIVVREHFEMLALTWSPGQGSPPHEHSGSVCVVRIIQGTAVEAYYSIAPDGFVDLEYEETVAAGQITSLHDAGIHAVRNGSSNGETLVTLHVYSPPLRAGRRFVPIFDGVTGAPRQRAWVRG
jgi:predicted metal-dependent enzyme (double-stranded beta helix superfamily)